MRPTVIAGNWKMHGTSTFVDEFTAVLCQKLSQLSSDALSNTQLILCAPFIFLPALQAKLSSSPVAWGAQDVSKHKEGAFTGEVSASMLSDFACQYTLVGHSERRAYHQESNELVAQKLEAALAQGLTPVLCVGETLEQREADQTLTVIKQQLDAVLALNSNDQIFAKTIVAYEPVWAIGTGRTATPEQAQAVHAAIRSHIALQDADVAQKMPILYGGSVKVDNAQQLLAMPDIDGALIGGASLDVDSFLGIALCNN